MSNEHNICLVLGCGSEGASWIRSQPKDKTYIGVDVEDVSLRGVENPVCADLLHLPFPGGSVDMVLADFALNALIGRKPNAPEILSNPEILSEINFPHLVRNWYTEILGCSVQKVRDNITYVGTLIQLSAIEEMWRVLADKGELELVDKKDNLVRIKEGFSQVLPFGDKAAFEEVPITGEDLKRSKSLRDKIGTSDKVSKLVISKRLLANSANFFYGSFSNSGNPVRVLAEAGY